MSEVELKIEEILEGKQNPFWFVYDRDSLTRKFNDYYENNKEEIRKVIEEIIQKRKINLKQLDNLLIVYFENRFFKTDDKEILKAVSQFAEKSKDNCKNIKLLIILSGMYADTDAFEEHIRDISDLLDE